MSLTLLALHGFTRNGVVMREALGKLDEELGAHVELVYPDAPHVCSPGTVERLQNRQPPHLCWWDASDDGSVYHGWERTLEVTRELIERHAPVAVLGFSQGAILAATLAALASRGKLAPLEFAVMIGGALPRAPALLDEFDEVVNVPSFHVWGGRDRWAGSRSPALVERFAPAQREVATWEGGHSVPTEGPAARRLVEFVQRFARL